MRKEFLQCLLAGFQVACENHLTHGVDTVTFEEHVFRAGQSDTFCAKCDGLSGLLGSIRVRANTHASYLLTPAHKLRVVLVSSALLSRLVLL